MQGFISDRAIRAATGMITLVLCAAVVSACTAAATSQGEMRASRTPARTSPTSSPSSARSFSPDSIAIRSKTNRGSELVLEVTAPPQTTFRIGQDLTYSIDCRVTSQDNRDPVSYRVVCPRQSPVGRLIATISYGDFGYSFTKAL